MKKWIFLLILGLLIGFAIKYAVNPAGDEDGVVYDGNKDETGTKVETDLIKVSAPRRNAKVSSPLKITGEARGNWYFEATFPVKLLDGNGKILAESYATAQGEWMTTDFVPFTLELSFSGPNTDSGSLILEKSNASGLPEHDDHVTVPVRFR